MLLNQVSEQLPPELPLIIAAVGGRYWRSRLISHSPRSSPEFLVRTTVGPVRFAQSRARSDSPVWLSITVALNQVLDERAVVELVR